MPINTSIKVITGNESAAVGVTLCRPDVITIYPVTPQTKIIEELSKYHYQGILKAEMINVEGENSAMNVITAASLAGARVFTATSSWGLVFMYDALLATAGLRAPVVMVNVNRESPGIIAVSSGQQDMISIRDSGWIFLVAENCQEILDMVIMSYRLAEDYEIQLPVMVHYDGFYLSHLAERVEIPDQNIIDDFLSILKKQPERQKLVSGKPIGCGTHGILEGYLELRYKHHKALEHAKDKFEEIENDFNMRLCRSYGGTLENYRLDDAEIVLVASGSACGTIKTVIDQARERDINVGLVRIRMFRPFPAKKLINVLKNKKAVGVIDRSICFGFNGGSIYIELMSLARQIGNMPILSFIGGIANMDINTSHINMIIEKVHAASKGVLYQEVMWIDINE